LLDIAYDAVIAVLPKNQFGRTIERDGEPENTDGKTTSLRSRLLHTHLKKTPNVYETSRALGDTDSIHKYFPTPLLNDVKSGYLFTLPAN
jgi:hypothetical protein